MKKFKFKVGCYSIFFFLLIFSITSANATSITFDIESTVNYGMGHNSDLDNYIGSSAILSFTVDQSYEDSSYFMISSSEWSLSFDGYDYGDIQGYASFYASSGGYFYLSTDTQTGNVMLDYLSIKSFRFSDSMDFTGIDFGNMQSTELETLCNMVVNAMIGETGNISIYDEVTIYNLGDDGQGRLPWNTLITTINSVNYTITASETLHTPEPTTMILLSIGILGLAGVSRRKK